MLRASFMYAFTGSVLDAACACLASNGAAASLAVTGPRAAIGQATPPAGCLQRRAKGSGPRYQRASGWLGALASRTISWPGSKTSTVKHSKEASVLAQGFVIVS
jgi:hypothetical protein